MPYNVVNGGDNVLQWTVRTNTSNSKRVQTCLLEYPMEDVDFIHELVTRECNLILMAYMILIYYELLDGPSVLDTSSDEEKAELYTMFYRIQGMYTHITIRYSYNVYHIGERRTASGPSTVAGKKNTRWVVLAMDHVSMLCYLFCIYSKIY